MVKGTVVSCFFFPLDVSGRQHFESVHNCVYFAVRVLDYQYEWVEFFFHLLVSAVVCGIKQVCLGCRTLPVRGTELLIFPQNIQLDLDLHVCGFPCTDVSTELCCNCAGMGKSWDENDNKSDTSRISCWYMSFRTLGSIIKHFFWTAPVLFMSVCLSLWALSPLSWQNYFPFGKGDAEAFGRKWADCIVFSHLAQEAQAGLWKQHS